MVMECLDLLRLRQMQRLPVVGLQWAEPWESCRSGEPWGRGRVVAASDFVHTSFRDGSCTSHTEAWDSAGISTLC